MTRAELIDLLASGQSTLSERDLESAAKLMLQKMSEALASRERIEIRGFGGFTLGSRPARMGRNPRTGSPVAVPARYSPHFKPGKEPREWVIAEIVALRRTNLLREG